MADVGEAWQNGYAERLIRAIKEEEVDLSEYIDYHDAYQQIGLFLDDVYMHKRIHSSLGYLTPAQFEEQWRYEYTLSLESELEIAGKVSNFRGSLQSMQVHFIRNATLIIRAGPQHILVDPMLGPKGSLPPLALLRHRPRRNPTVPLPPNAESALETITAGLITHCRQGHLDHLDRAGWHLLAQQQVPVYCNCLDEAYLQRRGVMTIPLQPNQRQEFLGGSIVAFETAHGHGVIGKLMGPGLGYLIELPDEPSIYISGDTVLTPIVRRVLTDLRPDVAVLNAGSASLDIGRPILMPMTEMLEFTHLASGTVIAIHLEALNHCSVTRAQFWQAVTQAGLAHKVRILADGEVLAV